MKDYASKEGHSKVVNQLSMQKMSVMARTRSKENVLDDSDQINEVQVQKDNKNSKNNKTVDAEIKVLEKEIKIIESNVEVNQKREKDNTAEFNSIITQEEEVKSDKLKIEKTINIKDVLIENKNETLDTNIVNSEELKDQNKNVENNENKKENIILNLPLKNEIPNEIINNSIEPLESNKEIIEKNKLVIKDKNTSVNVPIKDEESVSQCTMPPPMDPPRSWDFIQTSIMLTTVINEKTEKPPRESIEQIPDPIVCTVNPDDSELEWGSDESLPTDPNQISPGIDKKEEKKKKKTFYNFITTKLMNTNKNRVSVSADSIIDGITTNKHVRNKSLTSLSTFKITDSSDVNKALYQLSPEMNFAHSSFSKSKSFNEHIPIENTDKNLEFERSKSLCLELKQNYDTSENQQRDSDSQSDDSLRSKRSLLLSMRMPKVHDEHHDDYHLDQVHKDNETSEDEGPHYWYSPNKKNDKIIQQDTVIRNNSESEDSE